MPMYTGLARVARSTGCKVVEVAGWRTRGHGQMGPVHTIVAHHDAAPIKSADSAVLGDIVRNAKSQFWIDRDGTIYVVAAGLCYHAGVVHHGDWSNDNAIGIEARNNGLGQPWTDAQLDAYVRLCAALVEEFDLDVADVRSHAEVAAPAGRKTDPSFRTPRLTMTGFRSAVGRGYWKATLTPAEAVENATVGDGKTTWPAQALPVAGAHTADSHNAWVRLMADVDIKASSLGLSLQRWLGGLGYYTGWLDGQFGPLSVRALQSFLKDKGHYAGAIDGGRGPMTVRAEVAYLNSQRQHYDKITPAPTTPTEEPMSKQIVTEALADFEVPYYDHSRRETRNLPLPQSLRYISLGNGKLLDGQIELAGQVAGLSEAVKALADHQGQDGAAIIAAVKEATTAAFNAALPAEITVPLDGPTLTEEA